MLGDKPWGFWTFRLNWVGVNTKRWSTNTFHFRWKCESNWGGYKQNLQEKKRKIESVKQKIKPKEMKRTYFKGRCWDKFDIGQGVTFLFVFAKLKWQCIYSVWALSARISSAISWVVLLFPHDSLSRPWDYQLLTLMISKTGGKLLGCTYCAIWEQCVTGEFYLD